MQLQLGWKAGTEQYPPEQLLEYAIAAEKAGFDSIDVSDHFHPGASGAKPALYGHGLALQLLKPIASFSARE